MTSLQLITAQTIVSTKNFQSQFAAMVKAAQKKGIYYNVVKNGESIGVFLPTDFWESLLEDMEALSSPNYLRSIKEAREQFEKGEDYSMEDVFNE